MLWTGDIEEISHLWVMKDFYLEVANLYHVLLTVKQLLWVAFLLIEIRINSIVVEQFPSCIMKEQFSGVAKFFPLLVNTIRQTLF